MKGEMICRGHLGGYVEGGDDATFYPDLWEWFVKQLGVKSVVDVGAGDGVAVDYFDRLFITHPRSAEFPWGSVIGVDGVDTGHPKIDVHDYTEGPYFTRDRDLCWSCEFVEHVEEKFMPNFLATFKCAHYIAMTHAAPGQAGHHHVNCRSQDYWIGVMAAMGYRFDSVMNEHVRTISRANTSPWNHFARSGLFFERY